MCANVVWANEKFIIAGGELATLFHQKPQLNALGEVHHGVYHDVINHILKETGLDRDYQLIVYPTPRAKHGFVKKQFACYSPGIDTFSDPQKELKGLSVLRSSPINKALVRVISGFNMPLVTNASDVTKQDSLSYVDGVPINDIMQKMLDNAGAVYPVDTEYESIKMLQANRVTKAIVFYPDVIFAYKKLKREKHFPYDDEFMPLVINDNVICHQSHKPAFNLIEKKLNEMRTSGKLKELLGEAYLEERY